MGLSMSIDRKLSTERSPLRSVGLFKQNPIDQYMRTLQALRNQRVHDTLDLRQHPIACLLEALAYSIKNEAHHPQGSTHLMEQLNQYDVAEVQSCAEAALLTDHPVVRTYLSLLHAAELSSPK